MRNNLYKKLFFIVMVCALVLRFGFVFSFFNTSELHEDSPDYVEVASNIISGNGFTTGISNEYHIATTGTPKVGHVGPGWPLIIAPFLMFGDKGIVIVRLLNVVFGTLSVFLIMIVTQRFFRKGIIVLFVGLVMSFHPFLIHYTAYLLTETISVFLFSLYFFILTNKQNAKNWILSGFVLGYLVLVRGSFFLYIIPSLIIIFILNNNKNLFGSISKNIKISLIHILPFILIIFPWTIRNYMVFDELILTPTVGGGVFLYQMGLKCDTELSDEMKEIEFANFKSIYWTPKNPDEELKIGSDFGKMGLEMIIHNPNEYFLVCVENFKNFWCYSVGNFKGRSLNVALSGFINIWGKMMQIFILLGIVLLIYKKRWIIMLQLLLPIGYLTGIHTLLYGMKRYRLPVEPLVIIIACFGFYQLIILSKQWFKNIHELEKAGEVK